MQHPLPQLQPSLSRVHLMLTCLCDTFYPEVGLATADCLEALGYQVVFQEQQICCGQPAFNSGDRPSALKVARYHLKVFRDAEAVVAPSGSCTAMVRSGYAQLFADQPDLPEALRLAERTFELSEFISMAGVKTWPGRYLRRIAIHRSCHMRELSPQAGAEPLLRSIEGLEIANLKTPEQCCGFGGTFSVTFPVVSGEMGDCKLGDFAGSGAEEIVSSDMGCLIHLRGIQTKRIQDGIAPGPPLRHYAEILSASLKTGGVVAQR